MHPMRVSARSALSLAALAVPVGLLAVLLGIIAGPVVGAGHAQPSPKLSYRLALLQTLTTAVPRLSAQAISEQLSLPPDGPGSLFQDDQGRQLVYIRLTEANPAHLAALARTGVAIVNVAAAYRTVTAWAAASQFAAVAALPSVENVEEEMRPFTSAGPPTARLDGHATAGCGQAVSEGDSQLRADLARSVFSLDGSGVTVGVLSDSFDQRSGAVTRALSDVLSGDLPGPGNPCGRLTAVEVISSSLRGGNDEGRGMLQLIHDLAPGARLQFAAANGLFDFGVNVHNLRAAGADILVDDVAFANEPWFQDGPGSLAISDVVAAGAAYFTAAGNSNVLLPNGHEAGSYEAPAYRPAACPAGLPALETSCHDFDPGAGVDTGAALTLTAGAAFVAAGQWAQPWYGITTDLDFFLLNDQGAVVASAVHTNATTFGTQKPFELLFYANPAGTPQSYRMVVGRATSGDSLTPRFKFVILNHTGLNDVEYAASAGGDIVGPTLMGHSGAAGAVSIAAIAYNQHANVEHYSSRGPMTLYFAPVYDANPAPALAVPQLLTKPELTASDGGQTTFFGNAAGPDVYRFFGTSAAAPHAAAVAALIKQRWGAGALPPPQLRAILMSTTQPITYASPLAAGAGLIDAYAAVASVTRTAPAIISTLQWTAIVNQPFSAAVIVTGTAPISLTAAALPAGLTVSGAVISGTPATAGTFDVPLTAVNEVGQDLKTVTLTVLEEHRLYLPVLQR